MTLDESVLALSLAKDGGGEAFVKFFDHYRAQLYRMVDLRMDRRIRGRVDPDDILQDAFVDALAKLENYLTRDDLPPFLWLRMVVAERLTQLHRHHLGAQMRDAGREVSIYSGPFPESSSMELAVQLAGTLTSPSQAASRSERVLQLEHALNDLDPLDREVLTLRSLELLTNSETAAVLQISPQAASNRFVRALGRLRSTLGQIRGEA
ncbi:MAG: sigma-70 family RNA polymerase sigma factor [Planctomycetales bacterium]|nr:sigma-70 family RNA polymerase sigma factor [Planctomycetales bacterium]MCB1958043.1 sigma-70 family RNA polymerase sigma factor [Rhodocyclaceae bacterium]